MSVNVDRNRQPKGTPVGGQFATGSRLGADGSVQLADDESPAAPIGREEAIALAREAGTAGWHAPGTGYVDGAVQVEGPGGHSGRQATVFPIDGHWRVVVSEPQSGYVRGAVLVEDVDSLGEGVRLGEANLGWGSTGIAQGSRTPWGQADDVREVAPGIAIADTDSHGGIKLSPERNRQIPAALRQRSGWYEEDCEAYIPSMYFPDELRARRRNGYTVDRDAETERVNAEARVRDWFPDTYEKATGQTIEPGQSHMRDQQLWARAHADDWIVDGASYSADRPGMVEVSARRHGETRSFYVDAEEYAGRTGTGELGRNGRFVVDPDRHEEMPAKVEPEPVQVPTQRYTGVSTDLRPSQQRQVARDLAKYFRFDDGAVKSLEQVIADGGVSGKSVSVDAGKRTYYLEMKEFEGDSREILLIVSKAMWDAFEGPDTRTPRESARQDMEYARHGLEAVADGARYRSMEWQRANERYDKAREHYEAVVAESNN